MGNRLSDDLAIECKSSHRQKNTWEVSLLQQRRTTSPHLEAKPRLHNNQTQYQGWGWIFTWTNTDELENSLMFSSQMSLWQIHFSEVQIISLITGTSLEMLCPLMSGHYCVWCYKEFKSYSFVNHSAASLFVINIFAKGACIVRLLCHLRATAFSKHDRWWYPVWTSMWTTVKLQYLFHMNLGRQLQGHSCCSLLGP